MLLVLSTRRFLYILIITHTNGDMSHFAKATRAPAWRMLVFDDWP